MDSSLAPLKKYIYLATLGLSCSTWDLPSSLWHAQAPGTVKDTTLLLGPHLLSNQVLVVLKGGKNTVVAWDRFEGLYHGQMEPSAPDSSGYFPAAL